MGANVLACFPSGISKLSNCFPYCMGLHLLNGANAQPLVMRGASSWSDGILLASRSCVRPDASPPIGGGDATHCYLSAPVGVTATDVAAGACTYAYACSTWVSNRSLVTNTPVPALDYASSEPQNDDGVRVALSGQPMVVAGGALMRLRFLPYQTVPEFVPLACYGPRRF